MVTNVESRKSEKIMKKTFILITLAAVSLFSCVKPEFDQTVDPANEYNATLTASVPKSKVTIADDNIKLSWNNGDEISVLTSNGVYKTFVYNGSDGAATAEFKGYLDEGETIGGYAIYPANSQHSVNEGVPSINLQSEYQWNASEIMGPMVAVVSEGEALFTHAGGLFAFDAKNVPAGAKGFKFSTAAKEVTGLFPYVEEVVTAGNSEEGSSVTMWFNALEQDSDMKFYIPVPVGTYEDFTVSYIESDNSEKIIRSSASKNIIAAATVKLFTVKVKNDSYYVTAAGSVEADGLSWASATTLDNALAMAEDGDIIHVAAGTYKPQNALAYNDDAPEEDGFKSFLIDKNITLVGGYPQAPSEGAEADASANKTILDGDSKAYHTLIVAARKTSDKKVVINGITVKGGNAAKSSVTVTLNGNTLNGGQGGGVALLGTSAELNNVTVSENKGGDAGGMFSVASKIKMTGCTITSNNATSNGGGARLNPGTDVEMDGCFINGNTAAYAGGLYLYTASGNALSAKIRNTDITGNTATSNYGGVWLRDDSGKNLMQTTFDGCTFSANTAIMASAVYNLNACVTYTSCVFSANKNKTGNGIIVSYENSITTFDKCTIKNNDFETGGAGIVFIYTNAKNTNPTVTITNSSFVNNKSIGNTGALWLRGDNGKITCNCVNNTFSGNTASREGAIFAYQTANAVNLVSNTFTGNQGHAINIGTASVLSYNNIISGTINGTVTHKCSIVGTTYYDADGKTAVVTPAWNAETMLGALTTDGVCPLLLPDANPAFTYGMSSTQLQALANDYVSADVLSKDQLGNTRTGNVIGAWVANKTNE